MIPSSLAFIRKKFADYYRDASFAILPPSLIKRREFGFALFEGQMARHKCFGSEEELRMFLRVNVPSDVYFSCAYYENPEVVMEKKGWLGADLVFDIDADHIVSSCGKVHDTWICGRCGFDGRGVVPGECPVCSGEKFVVKTWPCEECLESAKREAVKLLDMLREDFGFSEKDMHAFFSGHRGYHVHVEDEAIRELDVAARKEIVDYVCGLGLDMGFNSMNRRNLSKSSFPIAPHMDDPGWRGRVATCMHDFIQKAERNAYAELGLKKNPVDAMIQSKEAIVKGWNDVGPYRAVKGVGFETWKRIVDYCADSLSARVDTVVTTDIHRLIRLSGALHGKTGLRKVEVPTSNIDTFDPFTSALAFKKGTTCVFVSDAPEFRLGDEAFGPYKNQRVELSTAAAVLLVCRNRAEVTE